MTENNQWQQKFARPTNQHPASQEPEEAVATVVFIQGEDAQGEPQWAYALIPADQFLAFRLAEEAGNYAVDDYGTVVNYGKGHEPPPEIQQEMAEKYQCNPNFEVELEAALSEVLEQLPENWEDDFKA